ncbi:uncharacterized protein TNCV_5069311 [Trichonephila clavipes]|nr:uncharacterized protein TNCV_5069311 [Trichonephila clavipes]
MLRRPLQQPYDGPFKVLQRKDKVFFLDINGKRVSVSIDRCKPAFILNTEDLQFTKPRMKHLLLGTCQCNSFNTRATVELIQQLQRLPSHLHVLVAKFIFQPGIVDTGRALSWAVVAEPRTPNQRYRFMGSKPVATEDPPCRGANAG